MDSQKLAGWIATAIGAIVLAHVLSISQRPSPRAIDGGVAPAAAPKATVDPQTPAKKGPIVRDIAIE